MKEERVAIRTLRRIECTCATGECGQHVKRIAAPTDDTSATIALLNAALALGTRMHISLMPTLDRFAEIEEVLLLWASTKKHVATHLYNRGTFGVQQVDIGNEVESRLMITLHIPDELWWERTKPAVAAVLGEEVGP